MNYSNIGASLRTQKGFAWVFGAVFIGAVIALGVFANTTRAEDPAEEPQDQNQEEVLPPPEETPSDEGVVQDEGATTSDDGDGENDGEDEENGEEGDGQVEGAAFSALSAFGNNNNEDHENEKVDICHQPPGQSNSWNSQSVNESATASGHSFHSGDIIPPFDYWWRDVFHHWHLGHFDGKNWDSEGQAIWNNKCQVPPETGTVTIIKQVVGAGDQEVPSTWSFDFSGDWNFSLANEDSSITEENLQSGSYTITESDPDDDNWTLVGIECSEGGNGDGNTAYVTLDGDEDVTCTFTNEYRKPEEPKNSVTLHAQKIVCDEESDLPNWGDHEPVTSITSTTASDWMYNEGTNKGCFLADWDFEWSYGDVANPGDNLTSTGGAGWNAFTGGLAVVDLSNEPNEIHVREIPQEGYIPFTGANTTENESAEIYCSDDVLNYDNWDFIRNPQVDTDYYCVAWNVLVPKEENFCRVEVVSDDTNKVVETGAFAVPTWDGHTAWTANIPFATWIWKAFQVENPTQDETYTFKKTFAVEDVNDALLSVAADNSYEVFINGNPVTADATENNFQIGTQDNNIDVASYLTENALNSIEVRVKNWAQGGGTAESNPAGALYRLVVNEESEGLCEQPPVDETTDVTICKYDEQKNELSGWTVMLLGDYVESVNVPSNGTEVFSSALTNGDPYAFIANGTYTYRPGYSGDISDAGFTKRTPGNDPIDPTGQPYDPWYDVNELPAPYVWARGYLGITVDDEPAPGTEWGNIFNSLHTYALGYTGNGAGAKFEILDDKYPDNSGSLDVGIYEGYVGTTGENGCVTFEDVPFGEYTLDEILQDGWTNVSGKGTDVIVGEKENNFTLVNTDGEGCLIDGHKYDEEGNPLSGWTIGLEMYPNYTIMNQLVAEDSEDEIMLPEGHTLIGTDETDENGYYCITGKLPEDGDWNFRGFEVLDQEGWNPVEYAFDGGEPAALNVDEELNLAFSGLFNQNWPEQIDFYNEEDGGGQDLTCDPEVNLLANGGFEAPEVTANGGGWELFANGTPLLEWVADLALDGTTDAPLEIQSGYSGWVGHDGSEQYAELDSTASTIISQDVPTTPGNKYRLSYWRAARPGTSPAEDNAVEAFVDGNSVDTSVFNIVEGNPYWYPSPTIEFTATGATTNIALKDIGPEQGGSSNSYGIFIDDVELYCVPKEEEHHNEVTICKYEVNDEEGENNPGMPGWTVGLNAYEPEPEVEFAKTVNPREYEGITGDDGCVTFHDVDLDQYLVEEDMQEGWQYFSGAGDGQVWNIDSDQGEYTFNLINQRTGGGDDDDDSSITIDKVVLGKNADANLLFNFNLDWLDSDVGASLSANDAPETFSNLSAGSYTISELIDTEDDWYVTDVDCGEATFFHDPGEEDVEILLGADEDVTCTFTNTYRPGDDGEDGGGDSSTSGGGGTSFRRSGGSSGGQVLGASTDNPFCPFLRDYQHISFNNDPSEVNKAKAFFNSYLGKSLPLDGVFDQAMFDAVVEFQSMFKPDVLDTWVTEYGFLDDEPTGYLYQTTKWKINSIMCPGYEAFPDQLILDSHGTSVASAQ